MAYYNDMTTVAEIRSEYLDIGKDMDDALLLSFIKDFSRQIEGITNNPFAPQVLTRHFDSPVAFPYAYPSGGYWYGGNLNPQQRTDILFDMPLLEVTQLLNGDGTAIDASNYLLEPANDYPKHSLRLKPTSTVMWQLDSSGSAPQAIALSGTWGFHEDYTNAWLDEGASIVDGSGINASVTTFTAPSGTVKAGQLLKCGAEFMYARKVVEDAGNETVTVVRGVNGSTAAIHATGAAVLRWDYALVGELCRRAVVAMYKVRANPVGETIVVDGVTFATPKDVTAYVAKQLNSWGGFTREGIG